jgi:hypothetical protein
MNSTTDEPRALTPARMERMRDWLFVSDRRTCLVVFLATLGVYLLTAHYFTGQISDTQAVSWPAYEFIHHGTFRLDNAHNLPVNNEWFVRADGHLVVGRMAGPVLAAIPLTALLAWTSFTPAILGSATAAILTAVAMTALFAALRRLVPARAALAGFVIVGFGTPVWTVAAGELWPQTVDICFLALMLYALSRNRVGWAGIALSPALLSRPHLALVALIMGVGLTVGRRSLRPLIGFGVPAAVSLALLFPYNHYTYGRWSLLGIYSAHTDTLTGADGGMGIHAYAWDALQTFFSTFQGLFTLSPVLLVAVVCIVRRPRYAPGWTGLALLSGLAYQAVQLRVDSWTGGAGFVGSRLTLELVVLAAPMAIVCYQPWGAGHPVRRFGTSVLAGAGLVVFFVGAVLSDYRIGGHYHTFWTTFYPAKVAMAAGPQGVLIVTVAVLAFVIFVAERYRACFSQATPAIVAPRDSPENEKLDTAAPDTSVERVEAGSR